jgi:hypothetical protein
VAEPFLDPSTTSKRQRDGCSLPIIGINFACEGHQARRSIEISGAKGFEALTALMILPQDVVVLSGDEDHQQGRRHGDPPHHCHRNGHVGTGDRAHKRVG